MNKYLCSDGTRVSEATIKRNLSKSYREHDDGTIRCRGCGGRAEGHSHPIPKARLKVLGLTERIWDPNFYIKTCHRCNLLLDNIRSQDFRDMNCYLECLELFKKFDRERYDKATLIAHISLET